MSVQRPKIAFKDSRGVIVDILDGIPVECVTVLTSKRGTVRGNHFHKKTTQYLYVVDGKLRLHTQSPGQPVRRRVIRRGDLVVTPPLERHAFEAIEDSLLLACAHGPRVGKNYERDTFRLDEPIAPSRT